jgi:hypothetical protein
MTIVNDDSRVMFQIVASLTDNFRGAIYDHNMFKVQTTASESVSFARRKLFQNELFLNA